MKTLFLFTLTLVLTLNLNARENPFVPTNAYEEEQARIVEENELDENNINEEQYIQEMQKKMNMITSQTEMKHDVNKNMVMEEKNSDSKKQMMMMKKETLSKKELEVLIKKAKNEAKNETKALIKKELESIKKQKPEQIVYVKPRSDVMVSEDEMHEDMQMEMEMKELKPLDFISISYNNKKLLINSDYSVIKKFSLDETKKIVIDYKAKVNFYTKKENLNSGNFEKITIGNHKKSKFFRIVLKLKDKPYKYKVTYKNNQISIMEK